MDYLIYATYGLLAFLLLYGSHLVKGKGVYKESFLSLSQMKAMQGFFAVCILLHHAGQKTCASWHPAQYTVHGLDLFVPFGYFFVGIFFFCSGYGLLRSVREKEGYLKGFCRKRILPIVFLFYVTAWILLPVRVLLGEKMNPLKYICYITGSMLCNSYSWYAIAIVIFYLFFYVSFRICKKEDHAIWLTTACVLAYTLLGTIVNHNVFWLRGEWWYNSVHLFWIGLLFARYEKPVLDFVKKHYGACLVSAIVVCVLFYGLSEIAQGIWSYYGETWGAPDTVLRRWGCLVTQVIASCGFVFAVFLIGMKLEIGNKALTWLGSVTLEFYLIHGLFVDLFGFQFEDSLKPLFYIRNAALYLVVVVALTIPSTLLLKKLKEMVFRK